jgi:putative inorganic carbon (hco3(-)) transporter
MTRHPIESPPSGGNPPPRRNNGTNVSPITIPPLKVPTRIFVVLGILLAIASAVGINLIPDLPPLLILGGVVGLILAILVFQKPELGAYILIFSVFTNLSDLFTEKGLPSINKPMVMLVVFSIFANYILKTGKLSSLPKITTIDIVLGIYVLSVVGSALVAVNQSRAFTAIIDLIKDVAVGYCIYYTLDTKAKVKVAMGVLLAAVAFVSVLGVVHVATGTSNTFWGFAQRSVFGQISDSDGQLRYAGPLGESNIWGQVLVSIIPIALYMIIKARTPVGKVLPAISGIFILLAILFTESRGAILALGVVSIIIAMDLRIRSTTLLLLASIMIMMLFILPAKYTERIKSLDILFQDQEFAYTNDESINGRRAKLLVGLSMFAQNPFLGVGFANYGDNYLLYGGELGLDSLALGVGSEGDDSENHAHSLYVEIIAETGIFGISSFLTFLGLIISGLYGMRKKTRISSKMEEREWSLLASSIMMSMITFLIAGLFLHGIGFRFIWVLIGLSHAFVYLDKKGKQVSVLSSGDLF